MFCSLEEAFNGPPVQKDKKKKRPQDPDRQGTAAPTPAAMSAAMPKSGSTLLRPEANDIDAGFPLPGESADGEAWQKAFTLEPSSTAALTLPAPSWPMPGQQVPTLWRQAVAQSQSLAQTQSQTQSQSQTNNSLDFAQRLDKLTAQLDSLTGGVNNGPGNNADLFLFVAVGLLLLLAIDSLLRFAIYMGTAKNRTAGGGVRGRWARWHARFK